VFTHTIALRDIKFPVAPKSIIIITGFPLRVAVNSTYPLSLVAATLFTGRGSYTSSYVNIFFYSLPSNS
jgi:hypothetical protein